MPSTYTPIATYTTSGSQASYTFTSIPSTYTDLILIIQGAADVSTTTALRVNGDTGSNYSFTYILGNGSSASSGRGSNQTNMVGTDISTSQTTLVGQFQNYSNTTTYKTVLTRGGAGDMDTIACVNLWRNTAAINSITAYLASPRYFINGTTLTLYGIAAA
jgi:hypothetical protein